MHVDLPKPRLLLRDSADTKSPQQPVECTVVIGALIEDDLGAGQQAHRDVQLADLGETARKTEPTRYQFIPDLGRPGRNIFETVVTHCILLFPHRPNAARKRTKRDGAFVSSKSPYCAP
jgi:hypothetical protein